MGEFKLPMLPNFVTAIVFGSQTVVIDVAKLSNDEIDELGSRWTTELKKKAARRRMPRRHTRVSR